MDNFLNERVYKAMHENNQNSNWYKYEGGREQLLKQERAEKMSDLNLRETRELAEAWKSCVADKFDKISPQYLVLFEQCVWLSLCVEWTELARISFDYSKSQITCSLEKMEVIL